MHVVLRPVVHEATQHAQHCCLQHDASCTALIACESCCLRCLQRSAALVARDRTCSIFSGIASDSQKYPPMAARNSCDASGGNCRIHHGVPRADRFRNDTSHRTLPRAGEFVQLTSAGLFSQTEGFVNLCSTCAKSWEGTEPITDALT